MENEAVSELPRGEVRSIEGDRHGGEPCQVERGIKADNTDVEYGCAVIG